MIPNTSTLTPALIADLENVLDDSLTATIPGAAVAIISPNGNWFGASGVADIATNTPLQPNDRFEIGSITKTFVAVALLQLVEAGQLTLEDTLTQWLPATITNNIPNAADITIEQILRHTSGIADYTEPLFALAATNPFVFLEEWQPEQLVEFITDIEPLFAPGESWEYSNTNFILAGLVIESVTGNTIASEIRNRILIPLNLENTFFAVEEPIPGNYINGYWDFDQNNTLDDITVTNLSWAWAAGAMISNTADLATFADGLFKGALLQSDTLARMLDRIPVDSPNYDSYGLGIGTIESPNRFWWIHRGQTLGFRANLWYSPAEQITYVELINGRSSDNLAGALLPTFRNGLENNNGENPTMVQVSLSTSTNFDSDLNALVEDQGTALTIRFDLDEPAPAGGLKVFVDSDIAQIVNRLDLPGFAFNPVTENINSALVGTSFDNSGFYLTIDEGATFGTFTINVFDNTEPDTFLPETFDGRVEATFSLRTQDQVPDEDLGDVGTLSDYTIDPNAATSTVLFADDASQLTDTPEPPMPPEPPMSELPLVSLHTGPNYLVEEEGTISAHVFNVTNATIPEGGLVVSVSAPGLSEFDLDGINVSEGGEIVEVREDGFDIRLTDFTVLVDLPVAADGEAEGLETASFSLEAGDGYEVNTEVFSGEFSLVDTAAEVPTDALNKLNDTIPLAVETGLSESNPVYQITNSLDFKVGNRYLNDDGTYTYIDASEDVDFYAVQLKAGDVISVDIDAIQRGEPPTNLNGYSNDGVGPYISQRIFDAQGNELAANWLANGTGELFASFDGYQEFVSPADGTYYIGLSGVDSGLPKERIEVFNTGGGRFIYDPFVPGSGDNSGSPEFDFPIYGEYDMTVTLNPEDILELPQFVGNTVGGGNPNDGGTLQPETPVVSLDFMATSFDPETGNLIAPYLVEGLPSTDSALILTFQVEGEIPEEGILVNVNSDNYLRQYISQRSFQGLPFTPGAALETILYDETGRETGFQFRISEPYTSIGFGAQSIGWADVIEPDSDQPENVTWFIEPGEGYTVDSNAGEITATYYDVGQTPQPTVIPEVGITVDKTELIESEGTLVTITFTLSEPPPEEGVVVQVNGSGEGILQQFDIFAMEIDGGTFPFPTEVFTGFLFKITEQQATITIPVFQDPFEEGLQGFSFSLSEASHYTVDPNAREATFTIADTPDSIAEVSLSSESGILVESENAIGVLTFNLTANPPTEGITATVDAPNFSEFDVDALTVTGGEITEITDSGFSLTITDATATIELPVLADGTAEGLEAATFTLTGSEGVTINPDTNAATLTLVDNPAQVPVTQEFAFNDTIPQALDLNLNPENLSTTVRGKISSEEPGEEFVPGFGSTNLSDFSEDVDLYKLDLKAGETVRIDVDAVGSFTTLLHPGVEQRLDSELRLFDADGNELVRNNNAASPDEELNRDPYLEFTASEAGTYYVGMSQLGNRNYDPFVENSGSGWIFPEIGVHVGEYDLTATLTTGDTPSTDLLDLTGQAGTVQIDIQDKETEAFFSNVVGFYRIEDETGTVVDPLTGTAIVPGEAGYTEAALRRSQVDAEGIGFSIRGTEAVVATLNGGSLYAPFIVADGTVEEALSGSKDAFFDFAAANPLGVDHVRKEGERYAFEDLLGGGDLDFNDAVFSVRTMAT